MALDPKFFDEEHSNTQQVVHTHVDNGPKISLAIEKNSKGFNFSVGVSNCSDVDQAIALVRQARSRLEILINTDDSTVTFNQKEN